MIINIDNQLFDLNVTAAMVQNALKPVPLEPGSIFLVDKTQIVLVKGDEEDWSLLNVETPYTLYDRGTYTTSQIKNFIGKQNWQYLGKAQGYKIQS